MVEEHLLRAVSSSHGAYYRRRPGCFVVPFPLILPMCNFPNVVNGETSLFPQGQFGILLFQTLDLRLQLDDFFLTGNGGPGDGPNFWSRRFDGLDRPPAQNPCQGAGHTILLQRILIGNPKGTDKGNGRQPETTCGHKEDQATRKESSG
jgi:hypothetical protein